MADLASPPKVSPGDRVAVLSPSFAAPAVAPAVHEQAMRRLTEATGLIPVEYPTTRRLNAPALDRAADLNAAFADPPIRAVLATIGGEDRAIPRREHQSTAEACLRASASESWPEAVHGGSPASSLAANGAPGS